MNATDRNIPIFVDLDGTLIQTDLLFESLLSGVKRNPTLLTEITDLAPEGASLSKALRRGTPRC